MAGPSCGILVQRPLGADDLAVVDNLISSIGFREGDDFWVTDTRKVGGNFVGEGRPFIISVELSHREEGELRAIRHCFGWEPNDEITLAAMCNATEDHSILADVAVSLAESLRGVVDLYGFVPLPEQVGIAVVDYKTISDCFAKYLVVAPPVLRKWRKDPEFHMVK